MKFGMRVKKIGKCIPNKNCVKKKVNHTKNAF